MNRILSIFLVGLTVGLLLAIQDLWWSWLPTTGLAGGLCYAIGTWVKR